MAVKQKNVCHFLFGATADGQEYAKPAGRSKVQPAGFETVQPANVHGDRRDRAGDDRGNSIAMSPQNSTEGQGER